MARRPRSSRLENRTNRLKLAARQKPYDFVTVSPGIALGYRRNKTGGVWVVRAADGHGGNWQKRIAVADDHEEPDGEHVLTFWQAQDRARTIARGSESHGDRPVTVGEALDQYEADLRVRGGHTANAQRVRFHLPPALASKTVALLGARELRQWRDSMLKRGLKPATADRSAAAMRAALTLAARDDPRIINTAAWKTGLAKLPDSEVARNIILSDDQVRAVVAAAYGVSTDFGLYIELAAVTGARESQIWRLEARDLEDDTATPRLMMPGSRKGRRRRIERRPLPIPLGLARALRRAARGRPADAPLLVVQKRVDLAFRRAAADAKLAPDATGYALRHSSIVRQLMAGVPTRIVAAAHDTSTAMIEKHYSKYITDHSDAVMRKALLHVGQPVEGNVVAIGGGKP